MTNDRFYQRLSEKLADLPDDPAFDAEGAWTRVQAPPHRRAAGAWLWPAGLAASVLLVGGLWFFSHHPAPAPDTVATLKTPAPRAAQREAAVVRPEAVRRGLETPKPVRRVLPQPAASSGVASVPVPEAAPALPESEPTAAPVEVAAEPAPQATPAETPGTVVLTIPVPGEDAPPVRKPFVARLFKQWKRYNRGETVDWNDLGLKPPKLAKARADSARFVPRIPN